MTEEVRLSLVTAVCVVALAVVAKWGLARQLDFVSRFAPIWVYVAYLATRDKRANSKPPGTVLGWSAVMIVITIAVALVYAV
jgi:hypothetical protein